MKEMRVSSNDRQHRNVRFRRFLWGILFVAVGVVVWSLRSHFYVWRAEGFLRHGSLIPALAYFQRASDSGERGVSFLMSRARCYRKLSEFDLMTNDLRAAVAAGAFSSDASIEMLMADGQRGNLKTLEPELTRLFTSYKDPDEVCEAFVLGCLTKYRLQDALQLLSVWEKDYPNDDRVHFLRGRIVEHEPDFDAALAEYEKAITLNPVNAAAAYNAGRVLLTKKNTEDALVYYLQSAETLGDPRPGWIAAAGCCRVLGQLKKAHEYLTKAESFSGGEISRAFRLVGDPTESAAVRIAAERGELAFAEENFPRAVSEFQTAIDASPSDWRMRYRLSQAQQKTGMNDEARRNAEIVRTTRAALDECDPLISLLKREPQNVEARYKIGMTFLLHVSQSQGVIWLNSVLDIQPDHAAAHKALAVYFEEHQDENPQFKSLAETHRRAIKETDDAAGR